LDDAQAQAKEANEMYVSVRGASLTDESMAFGSSPCLPISCKLTNRMLRSPKVVKRAEFDVIAGARMAFMKSGGRVED
jgi:hypothetical protein